MPIAYVPVDDPRRLDRLPVTERARLYGRWVRWELFPDVRSAVKAVAALQRDYARYDCERRRQYYEPRRVQHRKAIALTAAFRRLVGPGPCEYCGAPDARTVDHRIPRSRGGTDRLGNLARACLSCNSSKNNRTPEEWAAGYRPPKRVHA